MAATALDVDAIVKELNKARESSGNATVTTLNLIVYIDEDTMQDRALMRTEQLAQKYPARVIVLNALRDPGYEVSSSVEQVGESSRVKAERVEMGIAGMSPQAICNYVNTLRIVEIPNVLLWTSSNVASEFLFDDIIKMVDTVIVDSSGIAPDEFAISELAEFAGREQSSVYLRDLAFMRLAPWQDMVAQFFDDAQFVAELSKIDRVEIVAGSAAEAYYLVAWLGSRLHWTPCGRFELCGPGDHRISIIVKIEGEARRVRRVALSTNDATFVAELTDSPDTVCLSVKGRDGGPDRCSPLHHVDNLSLLERAFLIPAHDALFEESLLVLSKLLEFHG